MIFISDPKELEKLNNRDVYQFVCRRCGKTITKQFRLDRIKLHSTLMCRQCGISYTKQIKPESEKIKIRNKISAGHRKRTPEQIATAVKQHRQTCKRKYGDSNYRNLEQCRKTYKLRTGYDNPLKNPEVLAKIDESFKRRHNGLSFKEYIKSDEAACKRQDTISRRTQEDRKAITDKRNKTMRETGTRERVNKRMSEIMLSKTKEQKQQIRIKNEQSVLAKYGYRNVCFVPEFHEKIIDYWKNITPDQLATRLAKSISTQMTKYNQYPYRDNFGKRKYNYYGISFDSTWELAVWIYCTNNNILISRFPRTLKYTDSKKNSHLYIPDFLINGKLVEIKGDLFFKEDGTMYFPYTKKKINGKWVPLTSGEKEYMNDLYERKHQCGLTNGVEFWKESDCLKYIEYCDTKYPGWNTLYRKDNPYNPSYWCLTINNPGYYQQMYFVPKYINTTNNNRGVTPFDCNNKAQYTDITGKGLTPFDIK